LADPVTILPATKDRKETMAQNENDKPKTAEQALEEIWEESNYEDADEFLQLLREKGFVIISKKE
jgi:hypothetical protein